jgi:hypothetical protein
LEIENVKKIKFYTKINIRNFMGIVKKEEENTRMKKKFPLNFRFAKGVLLVLYFGLFSLNFVFP